MKKMTEKQFETIQDVITTLSSDFEFDIYDSEDIGQEIYLICCDVIRYYDEEKGDLFPYLLGCTRNRLISFKRSKYANSIKTEEGQESKYKLLNAFEIQDTDMIDYNIDSYVKEYDDYIDKNIPNNLRADYLRLKEGVPLTQSGKNNLLDYVSKVVEKLKNERS